MRERCLGGLSIGHEPRTGRHQKKFGRNARSIPDDGYEKAESGKLTGS